MEELVSIIVPTYNVEKYLKRCIDSILSQTYNNIEILIIDDGSKDNSGNIANEYEKKDSRVKVIHKGNGGVSSARNLGIKMAKGTWISFVDSDDWLEDNFVKELMDYTNNGEPDVILCGYNRVVEDNYEKIHANGEKIFFDDKKYLINTLNPQTGFGFCHMKLIRKKCIDGITFDEKLTVTEDALFNIKLSKQIKKAIFVEKALYNYRINNQSVVKKYDKNYANKYLNGIKANKEYIFKEYKTDNEVIQNYYNFVAYHVLLVAVNYCYNFDNKEKNKRKLLKKICNYDEFKEGIKKSNYDNLSFTRKISLFAIKHKLYLLMSLICKIRQIQNKGK